jgi:large repetitive protein
MTPMPRTDHREPTALERLLGQRRAAAVTDLGQTAIVAVLAVTLVIGVIGGVLVATVVQSVPLQAQTQVSLLAHRALQAGENAYVTALNTNPSLAQCSTDTSSSGTCRGVNYGHWNKVANSDTANGDAEYYAFGNPQPTFDPATNALTNLSVQIVGAANSSLTHNNYVFDTENINLASTNGFLTHVWWSNYESYSDTGDYSHCKYNWANNAYNGSGSGCNPGPIYFASNDYLFGPTYANDSIFVSGAGNGPSFGNGSANPKVPSTVETADPNCLFVDSNYGMNGSPANCANANSDVTLYDTTKSTKNNPVEAPPQSNAQLATEAKQYGCLYSGPTTISLSTTVVNHQTVGQMTVTSPDTVESTVSHGGTTSTWDNNNLSTNYTDCPNDGTTATIPASGIVYVESADGSASQPIQTGANPFDGYLANSVTNVTASPSPTPVVSGKTVTLTATITSSVPNIDAGASVSFSQTMTSRYGSSSQTISGCTSQADWTAATQVGSNPPTWQRSVTCPNVTESSSNTGAFSAVYSGGTYTATSQGNYGQVNTLSPGVTYGPNSQTTAGGCTACYYGETSTPDAEGDAFVSGPLSGELTIGSANNIVITGNLTYADCSGHWTTGQSGLQDFCPYSVAPPNDSLGLIANNYVEVNHPVTDGSRGGALASCAGTPGALCDASTANGATVNGSGRQGITIDAAILALTQSFVVNNYDQGSPEGTLAVYGSVQQFGRGPVGQFDANTGSLVTGYTKNYTWDPLLDYLSPPAYLVPSTAPWDLTSIDANAGEHPSSVCPPLTGPYNGPGSTPTPITNYCSQPAASGGLPGYPSSTAPSPPTNVTATAAVGGIATVSWTAPSNTGGSPILHYDVSPSPACAACTGLTAIPAGTTSATISGMTPGISYVFTVTATNANGTSDPSAPSPSISAPLVPYAPTNVSAVGNANQSVTVSWTDPSSPGSPIQLYTVTASPGGATCTKSSPTATSCTFSGLTVGAYYTFTVTATNGIGTSPASLPSNTVRVPTVPGAPTGVSATSFANTQSVVSWNPPASDGGITITGYRVTSSPGNRSCTTTSTAPATPATTCTVTGLTNGTAYTFTVTATNAIGTGLPSAPSAAATPAAVPGIPTIGTATAGNGQASVTFSTPATNGTPITGYTVTSNPGGIAATCATSPCVVTGLTNGTAYRFSVVANSAAGPSGSSNYTPYVTPVGPPGAPTGVTATSYANAQSVVNWAAPGSGGSTITGYTVTSSPGLKTCTTTGALSCTVSGLTNGISYTFTVTATNAKGPGPASAPSAPATPATVPGAPTGVTAVAGYQQGTVSWTAPASNGGAPITGYTVTATGGRTCSTSTTSCIVTGLTNGTSYTFTVVATNVPGNSPPSATSNSVVPTTTVPSPPTNVTASSFANAQSVVTWTAPTYTGGGTINQYVVTSSPGARTCTTTTTSCTVTGLTNGTAYTFTVTAAHTATAPTGPSAASSPSTPATPSTVPGAPTGVTGTTHANTQSTVTWSAPSSNGGAPITTYSVISSPGAKTCTTTGALSCTVAGLTNGTAYTFTVTATNGSGTGPSSAASAAVVPATVPGAPTAVTATSNASGQSVVHWTAPTSNGGLAISGYTVTSNAGQTCTTTGATTCTVAGLTNGVTYTFTVTATNAAGTGPASSASAPATPAGPPVAPTNVKAASGQNVSSTVSWSAPTDDGGTPITRYTVTSSPGGITCTTAGATTCTVTGLTNGTTYTFTVTATNIAGTSAASAPSNAVTPASTPGAPTGVTAVNVTNIQFGSSPRVLVSWVAPASTGGSPITEYTVTATNGGGTCSPPGTSTSCIFLGLVAGTSYTFTVTAINSIGSGPASGAATATASTVPDAPSAVTGTNATGIAYNASPQVTVTWAAPSTGGAPITGYTATASPGGATCTTAGTSCTMSSGLTAGTAYTFTVVATNSSGPGLASANSPSVTAATKPGAPTGVSGTSFANAQSVVSWTAPSNGGAAITGYTVASSSGQTCIVGTVTGVTGSTPAYAGSLNCTMTGLTNGNSYTFTVTATNVNGTSSPSATSAAVVPATAPSAPSGAAASASTVSSQLAVSWTASTTNGGTPITGYTVTSSGGQTCIVGTVTGVTGSTPAYAGSLNCTVTGLTAKTSYTFTVTATNAAGTGVASSPSTAVTAGIPGIVTGVSGTSNANAQSVVSWTAPTNGGAVITGYTVTSSSGQTCIVGTVTGVTGSTPAYAGSLNCTVTGLTNGNSYTFTVTATNVNGTSPPSAASAAVVPSTVPSAPTGVSGTSNANAQSVVSWTAPSTGGAPISGYTVTSSGGQTCSSSASPCTVTGLTNGISYTFTVKATNVNGTSSPSAASAAVVPSTVPDAPSGVTPSASSAATQLTVAWTAPVDGGAVITGYTVTSSGGQTCIVGTVTGVTGSTPAYAGSLNCTVTGLTAKTSYTFTVTATNVSGTSTASTASSSVTAGAPDAPTGATATSTTTATTVNVSWTAPADGGAVITGYKVTSNSGRTCTVGTVSGVTGSTPAYAGSLNCNVTSLTTKTTYTFTVTAINVNGTSPASATSNDIVAGTPPSPTNVTAVATTSATSATITWTDPTGVSGASTSRYTVIASPTATTPTACSTSLTGTSTTCVFTGLTTGTTYTFTVSAINTNGTGEPSAPSAPIKIGTPGAPTIGTTSTVNSTTIKANWTAPANNGGSSVTGYTATASTGGTAVGTCTTTAPTVTCNISGLSSATTYTVTVTATNANGTGPPSASSNAVSG